MTLDITSAFYPTSWEDEQPLLELISAGLMMSLPLLLPSAVEAAWRGCLSIRMYVGPNGVARPPGDGPTRESPPRFGPMTTSSPPYHEETVLREFPD